ncbi:MAG: hypothetical protein Q4G69_04985 [Planctomycetia bacterium]|nr:hypothetical protein [Planctomycetia bacterium]
MDGIRIAEEGENKYCRAGSAEIALGLSASDASEARIQFQDEPSKIRYRILGEWEGITLAVSITNIRNETHEISLVPDSSDGEIDYGVFPQTPFGQFRINVQAMKNGKEISPVAEYVITRLNRPVFWGKDAPDSFFGVHAEPISNILKALKAGGLNWVRLHDAGGQYSLWSSIEPEKGTWKFFDPELKNYRNHDLMIYGQLGGSPVWANYYGKGGPKTPSSYFIRFCAPTDDHLPDFENYAYQMVKHYKGMIQDWCLWNEPWGSFFHKGYDPAHDEYICFDNQGAAYAKVLKAAYKGAKRADPSVRISGFGTTSSADRFTAQIVEAGGFEYCDEIDYHQYAPRYFGFPGDGMKKGLDQTFAPIVKKYGSIGKNIIMSEGSSLTTGSNKGKPLYGIYKYVLPWKNTENYHDAGDRIVRFLLAYHVSGVKRVFLYTTHGHRNLTRCSFQLLLAGDGYPHPSLAALSAFAQNTEGSRFIEYRKLSPEVYAAVFEKSNGSSFAVITGKKTGRGTVHCSNPGAQAADLYGNPLSFPLKYMGYLQYITAPCPPDKLTFNP